TPKSQAASVVADVARAIKPDGTVVILLFEGTGEGPRQEDVAKFGTARWFSYYQQQELRMLFGPDFKVVREWRLEISPRPTIGCAARRVGTRTPDNVISQEGQRC